MGINSELEKEIINLINNFNNNLFDNVIKNAGNLLKSHKDLSILPNLIGASYAGKKDHVNAISFFQKAIEIEPNNNEILNNLGKSQIELNQFEESISSFKQSLKIDKKNFDTFFNLGIALFELGYYDEALDNYLIAISLNKNFDKLYYNAGIALSKIGKHKEAINYFEQTLKINKQNIKALNNLASEQINQGKYELAKYYLNQAITLDPNHSKAYNNLGAVYLKTDNYQLALESFTTAFDLNKDLVISAIQKHYIKRTFCDWSNQKELKEILEISIDPKQQISPWYCLSFEDNVKNHFIRASNFSKKFNLLKQNNKIYKNKKITIGYYAADFHGHAGMINMSGIFLNHNRNEFEIIGFYYGDIKKDETHYKVKSYFDKFFYVNDLDDIEILNLSLKNKIDIAIYRAGLTINARSSIFSHKVAPIQVNYLGYPGTSGQEGIDYIISDNFVFDFNNNLVNNFCYNIYIYKKNESTY